MDRRLEENLSRELRERVNDLLCATQLLAPLAQEKGTDRDREHLAILQRSLYQLIRTVSHLDLARGGGPEPCLRAVDAAGVCRDLGRALDSLLPLTGVSFTWSLGVEGVLTLADDDLLEQALLNLVTNAAQAAGKGGRVELRFDRRGSSLNYTVTDNGSGPACFEPEEDPDPFLKRPGGVGLGLVTARHIAEAHGGALILESSATGTRAVLSIPLRKEKSTTVRGPKDPPSWLGGFSPALVELSPVLPTSSYRAEDVE